MKGRSDEEGVNYPGRGRRLERLLGQSGSNVCVRCQGVEMKGRRIREKKQDNIHCPCYKAFKIEREKTIFLTKNRRAVVKTGSEGSEK